MDGVMKCLSVWMALGMLVPVSGGPALVPLPAMVEELPGDGYVLGAGTVVAAAGEAVEEAEALAGRLRGVTGHALPVAGEGAGVMLRLEPGLQELLGAEGYLLEAGPGGVRIEAAGRAGLFYGGQTLLQLLPAQVYGGKRVDGVEWRVPAVRIEDRPRFGWRGFMLDESRQFFGVEHVKRLLDAMAVHKLNRFHWHLTDDEGWRVEIKAYPKLTSVGAWRGSECALPNPREEKHKRYGGFYTQEQLREVVAYAKERHIEIMPEVDLPGHSLAIVTAYPEFLPEGAGGGVSAQGFRANALSPAKEEVYRFVETVFGELSAVFPFEYIHIGGDEVNHNAWKDCPQIKALMERERIANLHEVQVYFTQRLEKIFAARGKRIFGWNEVLDERLDRGTGILSWTGTAPGYQAARMGFPVVMAPGAHCYYDMIYPGAQGEPKSHWWAGPVSAARTYEFDPMAAGGNLPKEAKERILGVHAALWTEFVEPWKGDVLELPTYASHADYKTWPRLAALAEVGWTPQARRDYDDFERRLGLGSLGRLQQLGVHFRIPVPTATVKDGRIRVRLPFPGADVRYTLDGSVPGADSARVEGPVVLAGGDPAKFRARTFFGGRGSTMLAGAEPEGAANWHPELLGKGDGLVDFDVSAELNAPGIWRAVFRFVKGAHAVEVSGVELWINDALVARDAHAGRAGSAHRDNTWRLVVPAVPPGAKVVLRARLKGDGGNDSHGAIVLVKSGRLEPAARVECRIGGYQRSTAEKAADWDDGTFLWLADHPKAGDVVTWTFAEGVEPTSVAVETGERGGTKDQAVGALLEVTSDGRSWRSVGAFQYGKAQGGLPAGTRITGLRIRFTENQSTWVIVQDPVLR